MNEAAYYASSGIDPIAGKLVDDTYEVLEPFAEARYASVHQYHPNMMAPDSLLVKTSPIYDDTAPMEGSYTHIGDYNSGYPVPAPRSHFPTRGIPVEPEYYDDTVMDQPAPPHMELYQDSGSLPSYQVMRKP